MADVVLTFVIDTLEAPLDPILAATIEAIDTAGHALKTVRVTTDAGEQTVARGQVEGAPPPPGEPAPSEPTPAEPAPPEPAPPEPPVDTTASAL